MIFVLSLKYGGVWLDVKQTKLTVRSNVECHLSNVMTVKLILVYIATYARLFAR